jgi:hypothetical protein
MFQNQVGMHAWHLTINHCMNVFWIITGRILNVIQQDCGRRKNHHGFDSGTIIKWEEPVRKFSKRFKPCHQEEQIPNSALVKGNRQMGFQVDRVTHIILVLVRGDRQMGSQVALVKGNRHMGFQVDWVTHILWFWLKGIARWDLRFTEFSFG